jgi:hypothetical protein
MMLRLILLPLRMIMLLLRLIMLPFRMLRLLGFRLFRRRRRR